MFVTNNKLYNVMWIGVASIEHNLCDKDWKNLQFHRVLNHKNNILNTNTIKEYK